MFNYQLSRFFAATSSRKLVVRCRQELHKLLQLGPCTELKTIQIWCGSLQVRNFMYCDPSSLDSHRNYQRMLGAICTLLLSTVPRSVRRIRLGSPHYMALFGDPERQPALAHFERSIEHCESLESIKIVGPCNYFSAHKESLLLHVSPRYGDLVKSEHFSPGRGSDERFWHQV